MSSLRDHLQQILGRYVAAAVDESIAAYREVIAAGLGDSPSGRAKRSAKPSTGKKTSRASKRICPVPRCGKPGKGPRFRFFCEDHRDLPKAEQNKILAAAKKGPKNGVGTKSAAAAPAKAKRRRKKSKAAAKKTLTKSRPATATTPSPEKTATPS